MKGEHSAIAATRRGERSVENHKWGFPLFFCKIKFVWRRGLAPDVHSGLII